MDESNRAGERGEAGSPQFLPDAAVPALRRAIELAQTADDMQDVIEEAEAVLRRIGG